MMINPDIHIMLSQNVIVFNFILGRTIEFFVSINPTMRIIQGTGIIKLGCSRSPGNSPSISMYKDKAPVLSPNVAASIPDRPIDIVLSTLFNNGQRQKKPTSIVGMASKKGSIN